MRNYSVGEKEFLRIKFCKEMHISGGILDSLAIVANLIALLGLATVKQKNSQITFLLSLALSNLIYPIVDITFMLLFEAECQGEYINGYFHYPQGWNTTSHSLAYMSLVSIHDTAISATLYISFAMTMDRFVAILKPLRYIEIVTKKRLNIATVVCWSMAILGFLGMVLTVSTGPLDTWDQRYFEYIKNYYFFSYAFTFFLLALLIVVYSYIFIQIRKVLKFAAATKQNVRDKYKGTVTVFIIAGSFAVCWIPTNVRDIYFFSLSKSEIQLDYENVFLVYVVVRSIFRLNAILDPIIYLSANKQIRSSPLLKIFTRRLGKIRKASQVRMSEEKYILKRKYTEECIPSYKGTAV